MPNEISDARPSSLSHLVGQKAVIAQVATALDAAFEDHSRFDHGLLVGAGAREESASKCNRLGNGDRFSRSPGAVDYGHRGLECLAAKREGQRYHPY